MIEYRQVLVRMRMGASDRDVDRAGLTNRKTAARWRAVFEQHGWLDTRESVPELAELVAAFERPRAGAIAPSLCEPYREQVTRWASQGVDASTIRATLARLRGFTRARRRTSRSP